MTQYTAKKVYIKDAADNYAVPYVNPADTNNLGVVKPDGVTITAAADGTISTNNGNLRAITAYANEGELLTDSEGLADVTNYYNNSVGTGIDTIYVDYTEHGSPTISNEGILSSADDSNYVTTNSDIDLTGSDWDYIVPINLKANSLTSGCQLLYNSSRVTLITISTSLKVTLFFIGSPANFSHTTTNSVPLGKGFLKISHKGTSYSVKYSTDKETWTNIDAFTDANTPVGNNPISIGGGFSTLSMSNDEIEIDLSGIQFIKNSGLAYRPCLIIPYTESKTGSKIVDSYYRDRVNDMASQFGYAPYYTLSDTDFTLPQVELYGLIEKLSKSPDYTTAVTISDIYTVDKVYTFGYKSQATIKPSTPASTYTISYKKASATAYSTINAYGYMTLEFETGDMIYTSVAAGMDIYKEV